MIPRSQPSGGVAKRTQDLIVLYSTRNQLLSGFFVFLSSSLFLSPLLSISLSLSCSVSMSSSLSTTSGLLAYALSSFWRGPHFFWLRLRWVATRPVCERPMRNVAAVTPLSEYSDSGGLPHRLLIGAVPLSFFLSLPPLLSLSLSFLSLPLSPPSPSVLTGCLLFLTVFPLQLARCLPPTAASTIFQLPRFFLPPYPDIFH